MQSYENELSSRRWLILASAVLSFFAVGATFFAVPPLVPVLSEVFGLSHLELGVLMGAIAVPAIFLSIPLGAAVDRWPARAAGNLGLVVMLVGACLFALAPGFAFLVLGRVLFGIGGLAMNLLLARLISEAFSGRQLAFAMGIFMAVYPASMIVVFTVHPFLFDLLGRQGELMVLAGLAAIALPVHALTAPAGRSTSVVAPDAKATPFRVNRPLMALSLSWMLFFAAQASVPTFAPEWAGGGRGGLLTVTVLMWVALVFSPVAGAAIDRMGRPVLWVVCGLLLLSGVLAAMAAGVIPPLAAMLVVGLASSAVPTATYALPARLAPAERVGFAFGLITAFSNLGTVLGPPLAGALRDRTGEWGATWAVLAVVALVGAACATFIGKTENPGEKI